MNTSRDPAVTELPLEPEGLTLDLRIRHVSRAPNGVRGLDDVWLTRSADRRRHGG